MATIIKLEELEVESLSTETLEMISLLTTEILKISGKGFSFTDPFLLPKIRRQVKRHNNPYLSSLYQDYKKAIRESVSNGHFQTRPYQMFSYQQNNGFSQADTVMA